MNNKEVAQIVAGWTQKEAQKGQMIAKSSEEIVGEMESGQYVLFSHDNGEPLSYCRLITWGQEKPWVEVGSLVVDEDSRKHGIGSETAMAAINLAGELFPGAEIFALAENEKSHGLLTKIGGTEIANTALPTQVWDLCHQVDKECQHWGIFPRCMCKAFSLTHLAP